MGPERAVTADSEGDRRLNYGAVSAMNRPIGVPDEAWRRCVASANAGNCERRQEEDVEDAVHDPPRILLQCQQAHNSTRTGPVEAFADTPAIARQSGQD